MSLNESIVEDAALEWFGELGYAVVVLTDRNDLDDQLFGQFQRCAESGEKPAIEQKAKPTLSIHADKGQNRPMPFNKYDPACGSGGMFVQSEKFVESHGGKAKCEVRSASVKVKKSRPLDIRNSAFYFRPIRRALIEADLVDTALRDSAIPQSEASPQVLSKAKNNMVAFPGQLFYSTQIPLCLWFLAKNKAADAKRGLQICSVENHIALAA